MDQKSICKHNSMSGNPVRIGDGCATVTGYKLPQPLIRSDREGGSEVEARSQDTGRIALVRKKQEVRRTKQEGKARLLAFLQASTSHFDFAPLLRQREG